MHERRPLPGVRGLPAPARGPGRGRPGGLRLHAEPWLNESRPAIKRLQSQFRYCLLYRGSHSTDFDDSEKSSPVRAMGILIRGPGLRLTKTGY